MYRYYKHIRNYLFEIIQIEDCYQAQITNINNNCKKVIEIGDFEKCYIALNNIIKKWE